MQALFPFGTIIAFIYYIRKLNLGGKIMANIDKFKKVLSNALGIKNFDELTDDMGPDEIEDWDSLAQVELVAGFEDEFFINLDVIDVSRMYNIGAIKDTLKKYGVAV